MAALLLSGLVGAAEAAEHPEQNNARRVKAALDSIGINHPRIVNFAEDVSSRVDHGYLNLDQSRMGDGTLSFRYKARPRISVKHLELHYAPDDSDWQFTARKNAIIANYHFEF